MKNEISSNALKAQNELTNRMNNRPTTKSGEGENSWRGVLSSRGTKVAFVNAGITLVVSLVGFGYRHHLKKKQEKHNSQVRIEEYKKKESIKTSEFQRRKDIEYEEMKKEAALKAEMATDEEQRQLEKDPEKRAKKEASDIKEAVCKKLRLFEHNEVESIEINSANNSEGITPLVGDLIRLGDTSIIYSAPGVGKSILAAQLGINISKGSVPEFLPSDTKVSDKQQVFLYDAEQDDDDRTSRYGGIAGSLPLFHVYPGQFTTIYYLIEHILEHIVEKAAENTTIVLDNITALVPAPTAEDARILFIALTKMKEMAMLKSIRITFIIVAHSVKGCKSSEPNLDDLSGSANIARFAKSVYSLSLQEDGTVKLVATKNRHTISNCTYRLKKVGKPYLHFEAADDLELEPKNRNPKAWTPEKYNKLLELKKEGLTQKELAIRFGVNPKTIQRNLPKAKKMHGRA